MTTDATVIEDAPPPAPRPPARRRSGVAVLVTLLGSLVILLVIGQAVVAGLATAGGRASATYTAAVDGVTAISLDVAASSTTIRFADVTEAELTVTARGWGADTDWRLEVMGGELRVTDGNDAWFWPTFGSHQVRAELLLPQSLEGLVDANFDLGAGELDVAGDFAATTIDVGAGGLLFDGATTSLDVEISAGSADIVTTGADSLVLDVSAGDARLTAHGEPPSTTTVSVAAGDANVLLPDGDYAVTGDVSAGDRTIDVRTDPSAPNDLHVEVSAGTATVGYSD